MTGQNGGSGLVWINLVPAFVYALVITNQFVTGSLVLKLVVGATFIIAYMIAANMKYITFLTGIASAVILVGMAAAFTDSMLIKVLIGILVAFLEFVICVNVTSAKSK